MFIGHFAVAFAAKKAAPKTSLGTLVFAVCFLDFLWPIFLLLGWEHFTVVPGITEVVPLNFYDYPYSHSLVFSLLWSLLFGGAYFALRRDKKASLLLALAVLSHWVLDVVSHRPDMPLSPGSPYRFGLGLWNSLPATLMVECGMFLAGIWVYLRATRAMDRIGSWAFGAYALFLLASYFGNIFGPPPPDEKVVAWLGLSMWLLVAWAAWADRHRKAA